MAAVIPNIWPPNVISQPPDLGSINASAAAPAPELLPMGPAQSLNPALQAAAPALSNASMPMGTATAPAANASALSPAFGVAPPALSPSPALGNSTVSPAVNLTAANGSLPLTAVTPSVTAPVVSPASNLTVAQQTPSAPTPVAALPNQTAPAAIPAATPTATPATVPEATPADSLIPAANSSTAEQIAADNALQPLLSPAAREEPPATAPVNAPPPPPGPAATPNSTGTALPFGSTAGQAKAGIGSGAIAGIAVAAVAGVVITCSLLAFLMVRGRRRRQSSAVLTASNSRPVGSDPDQDGGSPVSLLPMHGSRNVSGSRNLDVDRWQALERAPLTGALLDSDNTAMSRSGTPKGSQLGV